MADPRTDDDTDEPSHVQANRARQQGNGVGQKDLDAQRDPTGEPSAEQKSFADAPAREPKTGKTGR